ncbi:hypothetical protein HY771_03475 [Candidatus Uhrbacteria bacterium]|nr:hypothetical protein [Candidatus Uhrbacteria bacterium]
MPLPAIAVTAGRLAAGTGRAVASSSAKGATGAAKVGSQTSQLKSQLQKARRQNQEQEPETNAQTTAMTQAISAGSPTQQLKQAISMARTNLLKAGAGNGEAESGDSQELVKIAAQRVIPRAIAFAANHIAGALELSTGGTAFVVTWLVRLITLGWLNVEMFYGRWIAKGKSKVIAPIAWDPFPMPIDKDANILQALVIIADIFCIILLILPFVLPIILFSAVVGGITSIF